MSNKYTKNGTAESLKKLGVIDEIVPEPAQGAHTDPKATAAAVKKAVLAALKELKRLSADELVAKRYDKFCAMGRYFEVKGK